MAPMPDARPRLDTTTVCIVDTHTHALAARAMRISLAAMDFADAVFISDSAADTGGARHVPIAPLAGREAYSRFVMKDLLRHVETEHVLLIQWDGYVINPAAWCADFLDYDYIGARWGFHDDAHNVGNGGFSLRSRRLLEALQDPAVDQFEPEDERICRFYRPRLEARHGIRFAPAAVADRFSFETTYPKDWPLGFHGLFNMWLFVSDAEMPALVPAMPERVIGSVQYLSLAKNLVDLKRLDAARLLLERRLQLRPDDTAAARLLTLARPPAPAAATPARNAPCPCGSGKRFKHCCGQAGLTAAPADGEARLAQALADHQAGRLDAARAGYTAILARGPNAIAEHYLGVLDMQAGRPAEGERRIRAALALRADVPDFYNNLGLSLRAQGRLDEAVAEYRRAIGLDPAYAPAWSNLGLDLHKLGDLDAALAAYDRAIALEPRFAQARFGRALVLLTRGDYAQGWAEYEWRRHCPEYAAGYRLPSGLGAPAWQGEALAGRRVLLIGEQGIGDTIQFVRYAARLADGGAWVAVYVHKPGLAPLIASATGVAAVFTAGQPLPAVDFHCHMLSLPHRLGSATPGAVPARVPYLAASASRRAAWRERIATLPGRLRVGLAWAGSPSNPDDRYRSCPFGALAPLFAVPGIDWVNLQLGAARADLGRIPNPVHDWGDAQTDFAETAALIAELDLVISVDTAIAHAAGALGVPVWVLLQKSADFRWLSGRDDSPWYPTARLFRQPAGGDWHAAVLAAKHALADLLQAAAARSVEGLR